MKELVKKIIEYGSKSRVLYVEDDEVTREVGCLYLNKFFPFVVTAKDGKEGLDFYENGKYDLVLTDICMPRMNGIELIRQIHRRNPKQQVIVISAYNDSEFIIPLVELGVDRFILKPMDSKKFIVAIYETILYLHVEKQKAFMEEKFRESAYQTEMDALEHIPHPVAVFNQNTFIKANQSFLKLTKAPSLEALKESKKSFSAFFVDAKEHLKGLTNQMFIEKLKKEENESLVVRIKPYSTEQYKINYTLISEEEKHMIILKTYA